MLPPIYSFPISAVFCILKMCQGAIDRYPIAKIDKDRILSFLSDPDRMQYDAPIPPRFDVSRTGTLQLDNFDDFLELGELINNFTTKLQDAFENLHKVYGDDEKVGEREDGSPISLIQAELAMEKSVGEIAIYFLCLFENCEWIKKEVGLDRDGTLRSEL